MLKRILASYEQSRVEEEGYREDEAPRTSSGSYTEIMQACYCQDSESRPEFTEVYERLVKIQSDYEAGSPGGEPCDESHEDPGTATISAHAEQPSSASAEVVVV